MCESTVILTRKNDDCNDNALTDIHNDWLEFLRIAVNFTSIGFPVSTLICLLWWFYIFSSDSAHCNIQLTTDVHMQRT